MGSRAGLKKPLRCRAGFRGAVVSLLGRLLAALHAFAGLTLAVHVDAFLEGGGERAARLLDDLARAGARARDFDLDFRRELAVAQHANAVAAAFHEADFPERVLRDLLPGVDLFAVNRLLDTAEIHLRE